MLDASPPLFALLISFAQAAVAADILIGDAKSQPESLTVAPDGVLIVGSASSPFVYRVRPGSSTAETFIDASAGPPGTFFFGMLADSATKYVVDMSADTGAGHYSSEEAHCAEKF